MIVDAFLRNDLNIIIIYVLSSDKIYLFTRWIHKSLVKLFYYYSVVSLIT